MLIGLSCFLNAKGTYRVRGDSGADIQKAIDKAFLKGGGTVVVPSGTYHIASIRLLSNINLHLEKGTVLLGSSNSEDYDSFPQNICTVNPENSSKALFYAYDSENITISGEGMVDGNGPSFFEIDPGRKGTYPKPPVERPLMVKFVRCSGVRMEGITLKDSPCWTVFLRLCDNIEIHGITITADQKMINNDGIDFDGCRHVRLSDSKIRTCDDCIVLRAIKENSDQHVVCEDIVVSDCDLNSACQTVRLGCPSDDVIRNAVFKNIRAGGNNGIFADFPVRYLAKGDSGQMDISNIEFDNFSGEFFGSALQIVSEAGVQTRNVDGLVFRNFNVKSKRSLRFIGNEGFEIGNVLLENFIAEFPDKVAPFVVRGCNRLIFKNVALNGKHMPDGIIP